MTAINTNTTAITTSIIQNKHILRTDRGRGHPGAFLGPGDRPPAERKRNISISLSLSLYIYIDTHLFKVIIIIRYILSL